MWRGIYITKDFELNKNLDSTTNCVFLIVTKTDPSNLYIYELN